MLELKNRNDEFVMLVLQDNEAKKLRLIAADKHISQMLQIENDVDFLSLLSDKLRQIIEEQIDNDLLDIIRNIRQLHFKANDRQFSFRIVRELPQNRHHVFRIILLPADKKNEIVAAFKQDMQEYLTVDASSQLPDVASMEYFIKLAHKYVANNQIDISFVYGALEQNSKEAQSLVAQAIRRNLRQDDIVGLMPENNIGILLIDVNSTSLNLTINRIRLSLKNDILLKSQFRDFNIGFAGVTINADNDVIQLSKKILDCN
jgi:hypothetical protein